MTIYRCHVVIVIMYGVKLLLHNITNTNELLSVQISSPKPIQVYKLGERFAIYLKSVD